MLVFRENIEMPGSVSNVQSVNIQPYLTNAFADLKPGVKASDLPSGIMLQSGEYRCPI